MAIKSMTDLELNGKTVVIHEDLNVPMKAGKIFSDKRIRSALSILKLALEKGAGVIVLSQLGRPTEGEYAEDFSLKPMAERLGQELGIDVKLAKIVDETKVNPGDVCRLENARFSKGEKNNPELAANYATLGNLYVMDVFATAYSSQVSTEGAIRCAREACAGPLLQAELDAFTKDLEAPSRPQSWSCSTIFGACRCVYRWRWHC